MIPTSTDEHAAVVRRVILVSGLVLIAKVLRTLGGNYRLIKPAVLQVAPPRPGQNGVGVSFIPFGSNGGILPPPLSLDLDALQILGEPDTVQDDIERGYLEATSGIALARA